MRNRQGADEAQAQGETMSDAPPPGRARYSKLAGAPADWGSQWFIPWNAQTRRVNWLRLALEMAAFVLLGMLVYHYAVR